MNSLRDILHEALDPVRFQSESLERTIRRAERREKRRRVSAALAGIALSVAGGLIVWSMFTGDGSLPGSRPNQSAGLFFPTYEPTGVVPGGILEGELVELRGCLFTYRDEGNTLHLLLWPSGYEARRLDGAIKVRDGSGAAVGAVGEFVSFGGGEINPLEVGGQSEADLLAEDLVGEIPDRCLSEHLFWKVNPSE